MQSSNTLYLKTVKCKTEWTTGIGKLHLMNDFGISQEK